VSAYCHGQLEQYFRVDLSLSPLTPSFLCESNSGNLVISDGDCHITLFFVAVWHSAGRYGAYRLATSSKGIYALADYPYQIIFTGINNFTVPLNFD
jgi:hypothetical protein